MAYKIKIESSFSAAHRLRGYKGKCENLHGHNWKVKAVFAADELDKTGMLMDFVKAKKLLSAVLKGLDHKDINSLSFFKKYNPTSELIAKFIFDKLNKNLKSGVILRKVSVWETPTSCASYSKS
ncbi:MAG: 6-carboxytetrahydropterin synthase QueD [Candidatus Omnitrophica bacterium]|nr:6-carboxytetrahydropterin synthase QueD [Candidatus Omnitrophota bacterium]